MDVREQEYAKTARKHVETLLKCPISDFQTVISGSGGESRHFYFLCDRPFTSKKLWHTEEDFVGKDGKKHWCAEIELFGTGKQVVLPPSIHPDTGEAYAWADGVFDTDMLPEIDSELLQKLTGQGERVEYEDEGPLDISDDEVMDYVDQLDLPTYCEDREGWIRLGMALHHQFDGAVEGLKIWNWFSKQSKKFDAGVSRQQWRSFKGKDSPITFASIIQAANDAQHQIVWDSIPDEFEDAEDSDDFEDDRPAKKAVKPAPEPKVKNTSNPLDDIPKHLLTVPGKLGLAVKHYNETAIQYQPQFAVQTALALGSVILGRRWKLEMVGKGTWSSLYFMNLGASGSGKEFTRTYLTSALEESKMGYLLGPEKYASEPGLYAALYDKPRHVSIVDEIGMQRQAMKKAPDANAESVNAKLTSLFGNLAGVYRAPSYSMNGKSKAQVAEEQARVIARPALTLVGMSTPSTFFDTLSQAQVLDGFLNRLIVVNSRLKKGLSSRNPWTPIPAKLKNWMIKFGMDADDYIEIENDFGDTYGLKHKDDPAVAEPPNVMQISKEASRIERMAEQEFIDLAQSYEQHGIQDLFVRCWEVMIRLSMIIAASNDSEVIEVEDVEWARDYVRFYQVEMAENVKTSIGVSPMMAIAEKVAEIVKDAGQSGVTARSVGQQFFQFRNLEKFDKEMVMYRLKTDHNIIELPVKDGKAGRPTDKLYCAEFAPLKRVRREET